MHVYFLTMGEDKMAKSEGGFIRLQTVIDKDIDPLAYRLFCHSAVYRAKLNFTWEGLESASVSLQRLRSSVFDWGQPGNPDTEILKAFTSALNDDLNMPKALAVTWDLVKSNLPPAVKKATILEMDHILGLRLGEWQPSEDEVPSEILTLVEQRTIARNEKRWGDADKIRDVVISKGYEIEDTAQGPKVRKKSN
jgi:cysteinyl-tRNA synthetase